MIWVLRPGTLAVCRLCAILENAGSLVELTPAEQTTAQWLGAR